MPPECGNEHPDLDGITCGEDLDHKGNHRRVLRSSNVLEWEQVKVKQRFTKEQLISMIGVERDKLTQTLDAAGTGSREADLIRTVIPIFQSQLYILEHAIDLLKD